MNNFRFFLHFPWRHLVLAPINCVSGFRLNAKTNERKTSSDPLYPECPEQKDWNSQNIRAEIENWKKSLFKKEDLTWFHDPEPEPLDLKQPRVKITFNQFVNRKSFLNHKVIDCNNLICVLVPTVFRFLFPNRGGFSRLFNLCCVPPNAYM